MLMPEQLPPTRNHSVAFSVEEVLWAAFGLCQVDKAPQPLPDDDLNSVERQFGVGAGASLRSIQFLAKHKIMVKLPEIFQRRSGYRFGISLLMQCQQTWQIQRKHQV